MMRGTRKNAIRPVWIASSLSLLFLVLAGCASSQAFRKGVRAAEKGDWDAAVLFYSKAMAEDPGDKASQNKLRRAKLEAGYLHFERGQAQREAGNLEAAIQEFHVAYQLNPSYIFAKNELEKVQKELEEARREKTELELRKERISEEGFPLPELNPQANIPLGLRFQDSEAKKVFDSLAKPAGINILYDEGFRDPKINVDLQNVTFLRALDILNIITNTFYRIIDPQTIIIVPDTPQKRREYENQVIKTFYLSNAEVKDVFSLLRTLIDARKIAQNEQLNAITIRDTPDKVEVAERIIRSNDKSKGEVVIDVELVEVNKSRLRELGIDTSIVGGITFNNPDTGGSSLTLNNTSPLGRGSLWTMTIPSFAYNLLFSQSNAELISKPQLRVTEGEKALVHIGDQIPIPTTSFSTTQTSGTGQFIPLTSFQYQNVGVQISIEPRVHHNNDVSLKLNVDLSSVTGQVTTGGVTQPVIGTREIETVIRLKDGETNLMAGLLSEGERSSLAGLPGLAEIPILRKLFGQSSKTVEKTDIVLSITPHIIRTANITEEDLRPLWVGTERDIRLMKQAKAAVPELTGMSPDMGEPDEAQDVPIRVPEELEVPSGKMPEADGSGQKMIPTIAIAPGELAVSKGDAFSVRVEMTTAELVTRLPFTINFDPTVLEYRGFERGEMVGPEDGGATIAESSQRGIVQFEIRTESSSPIGEQGTLAVLTFRAKKRGTSQLILRTTGIQLTEGAILPVQLRSAVVIVK